MKIGIFTCNYRPLINGLSISIDRFAHEFQLLGHRVYIFAPQYPGYHVKEEGVFRFPSLRVPTHHSYVLPIPFSSRIRRIIPYLSLDLIHAQHPFLLGPYSLRLARDLGTPLVFTHHTLYEKYAHYVPFFRAVAERLAISWAVAFANQADLVIAPTKGVKRLLEDQGVKSRLEVVPTGVYLSNGRDPFPLRHRLGISFDSLVCLYLGRLAKEKDLVFLLRAFRRIADGEERAVLLLVGEGDERMHLSCLARDLGIQARVIFAGPCPQEETHIYYEGADLFLFPSLSEAQGLVVLESMACGTPVVARPSLAIEEFLEDGRGGLLTGDDLESFADKALLLLKDQGLRHSLSFQAREMASRFSARACSAKMLGFYEELVQKRKVWYG